MGPVEGHHAYCGDGALFRHIIDVRAQPPRIMDEGAEKNLDGTINKIVWGVSYFIGFLFAAMTILDILEVFF
jgi:hypothetical protein